MILNIEHRRVKSAQCIKRISGQAMIECKELAGKVISSFKLYEDSIEGAEICIEFTDGTVFSSCLKIASALEAKVMRNEGGHPRLLKDYSTPPVAR
ncbi:MAG TPA: hypothetical protein VFE22_08555 [Edaphobacter sp.]|nr:hypothetical protein [Edaphobacter sp.]